MDRRDFLQQMVGAGVIVGAVSGPLRAEPPRSGAAGAAKVKWQNNLKSAQKLAIEQNKPIMIVFGATWCPPCRKLEKETLSDKRTVAIIERDFIPVHLDYDKETKIVKILDVERLPCMIILTPDADLLHKSVGYSEPKEFQQKLADALDKRNEVTQARGTSIVR